MAAPLVHLELHTGDLARACAFYAAVCGWRVETVHGYRALEWNGAIGGGVVECGTTRPAWLPYVEVRDVDAATAHAERLGATVLLAPRYGPEGRRSVVAVAGGAEVGFWEPR